MIERDPLVLSSALDLEGDLAFVAIDASGDLAVAGKVLKRSGVSHMQFAFVYAKMGRLTAS
jgi:hypothetical protein